MLISAEVSTICNAPSPRVAFFHSVASVARIFASAASRSGTSDGSGRSLSLGAGLVVTCTARPLAIIGGRATANPFDSRAMPTAFWQVTQCAPFEFGIRGAAYVHRSTPVCGTVCAASVGGGASPNDVATTTMSTEHDAPGEVWIASDPYAESVIASRSALVADGDAVGSALPSSADAEAPGVAVASPRGAQATSTPASTTAHRLAIAPRLSRAAARV